MIQIKEEETPYGPVVLFRSGNEFFVKSGTNWVTYVAGNAGYGYEARPMTEERALKMFDAAVRDSRVVYAATHRGEGSQGVSPAGSR